MLKTNVFLSIAVALALSLLVPGCGNGDATGSDGKSVTGLDKEAYDAALAQISKHWVKRPDGWTTYLWEGTSFAPVYYLRQIKEFSLDRVEANEVSAADKLNNIEWSGQIWFAKQPTREAGDNGVILGGSNGSIFRRPGQWSQWVDYQPMPLHMRKVKGAWLAEEDNSLVAGKIPTDAEFAKWGVK